MNKYKKTEIGLIPEDWDLKRIDEIGDVITGSTPSTKIKEYYGGEIDFIAPIDLDKQKYILNVKKK